ncbi:hypothetical protein DIC67_29395, partial [Klebsiella pneumoniae]
VVAGEKNGKTEAEPGRGEKEKAQDRILDRERGGEGKRVDLGGRRIIKKKKEITLTRSAHYKN